MWGVLKAIQDDLTEVIDLISELEQPELCGLLIRLRRNADALALYSRRINGSGSYKWFIEPSQEKDLCDFASENFGTNNMWG